MSDDPPDGDETLPGVNGASGSFGETPALAEGLLIDGRYRAVRKIGAGGMGEVWEVEHIHIRRRFALKTLVRRDGSSLPARAVERLVREAQMLASIHHGNVVSVTDFGHLPGGTPFCVMELLDGCSLQDALERGALPWSQCLRLMSQLVSGLCAAHDAGVIHRDLKPSNIFLLGEGESVTAKIIDFGIARSVTLDEGAQKLTRTGVLFGTPAYVSPEQALGEQVDPRSDLYSFGCVAYEMLTGRRPFPGTRVDEFLHGHLFVDPPPFDNATIPDWLESVVMRCLEKKRENRFEGAHALLAALEDESEVLPAASLPRPRPKRRPMRVGLASAGLVAAGVLGGWTLISSPSPELASGVAPMPPAAPLVSLPPVVDVEVGGALPMRDVVVIRPKLEPKQPRTPKRKPRRAKPDKRNDDLKPNDQPLGVDAASGPPLPSEPEPATMPVAKTERRDGIFRPF